jgi:hypothetical protein
MRIIHHASKSSELDLANKFFMGIDRDYIITVR